jgi:hypothetical protein
MISKESVSEITNHQQQSPKPVLLPLKKSASSNSCKFFPNSIKIRFKKTNVNSKKIPQEDFLIFFLENVPTFDFVREKNLSRKKNRILKEVVTIEEDDQEYHFND